jgi:hypothetical protein
MSDSNKAAIDAIVKDYLLSRGYNKAAAEMEGECNIDVTDNRALSKQVLSTITEDIVILSMNNGNYGIYDKEYSALRSWSLISLDLIKSEVLLLLMPIFVHCYIGLIRQGCIQEAREFWRSWEKDHAEVYSDELRALSMLTVPEQIQSEEFLSANTFICKVLKSRFTLKMSTFAYNLLSTFMVQNNLLLIASIMNERLQFEKDTDFPGSSPHIVELEGYVSSNVDKMLSVLELSAPGSGGDFKEDLLCKEWLKVLVRPKIISKDYNVKGNLYNNDIKLLIIDMVPMLMVITDG